MIDEVKQHIEGHQEVLINKELEELVESFTEEEEDEKTEAKPAMWILPKFTQILKDKIIECDPWMEPRKKITNMSMEAIMTSVAIFL
jgi:hypothetical protein